MIVLWIKTFHIISIITWFAGIFYLPRLFVYHSMATDDATIKWFKIMESKLYYTIMMPSMIVVIFFGSYLAVLNWHIYYNFYWLYLKLILVLLLVIYHFYCGHLLMLFKNDNNIRSDKFYRYLNELPVILLVAIVILVIIKPF